MQEARGKLFDNIIDILKFHKPQFFILENVRNLLSHDKGKTWEYISNQLTKIGYNFDKKSFIGKYGLTRLRVYASILNPWMWQRSDRVVDASMVDAKGHVMGNGYPQAKTISFGVDLRF